MAITKVVCSKCGKPLDRIPPYLAEGAGARLFQCDDCFYPGCVAPKKMPTHQVGLRRQLESLVEEMDRELTPV